MDDEKIQIVDNDSEADTCRKEITPRLYASGWSDEQIMEHLVELLKDLMRRKKFRNHLIHKRYLIAVDGSQKLVRDCPWEPEALKRHVGGEECIPEYCIFRLSGRQFRRHPDTKPALSGHLVS